MDTMDAQMSERIDGVIESLLQFTTLETQVKVATRYGTIRRLGQSEIAELLGVGSSTVGIYTSLPKDEIMKRRRIIMSEKMSGLTDEVIRRINKMAEWHIGYEKDYQQHTRKLTVKEITQILKRHEKEITIFQVRRILNGIRTAEEANQIKDEAKRKQVAISDTILAEKLLTDQGQHMTYEDIVRHIREHGKGTLTIANVFAIAQKLGDRCLMTRKTREWIGHFTPDEKARLIEENMGLIITICKRNGFLEEDRITNVKAHIFEELDFFDPAKGAVNPYIGMHTEYFVFGQLKKQKRTVEDKAISTGEFEGKDRRRVLPCQLSTQFVEASSADPLKSSRFGPFFTQKMPRNLTTTERKAVTAYIDLANEIILKEGRLPKGSEVAVSLDPENPKSKQSISLLLNHALEKYRKYAETTDEGLTDP